MPKFKPKTMTHRQRLDLINTPIVLLNHRTIHSQKRWAGVFVNDGFGEGYMARLQAGKQEDEDSPTGYRRGRVTQYDAGLYSLDYALLELIDG